MDGVDVDVVLVALVGLVTLAASAIRELALRTRVPALVGFLALGVALRALDGATGLVTPPVASGLRLLADLGIVALLFDVGLRSNPAALARRLPAASLVWAGNVGLSGLLGFLACRVLLDLALVPSLVAATALTATSVGVSVSAWREAGALDTPDGELLVDVAELDDLSAVALVGLLFAVAPVLGDGEAALLGAVTGAAGSFVLRLLLLAAGAALFARHAERHVTEWAARLPSAPQRMLVVLGVGLLIAALAGGLGFSLAIGAMLAGLLFSRDPEAVRTEEALQGLATFATPFFFVVTGMGVELEAVPHALAAGAVLLGAAVLGKVVGTAVPALAVTSRQGALLLGLSMVPRAEIATVVLDQARHALPGQVGPELYAAMVAVVAATCVLSPLALGRLLPATDAAPG
ncbi:MAG: cation:proton antiporter [Alphaproteobacteria bacterium]|nr:cation:proton antiporter [Alphaproteobacteria bacterium]